MTVIPLGDHRGMRNEVRWVCQCRRCCGVHGSADAVQYVWEWELVPGSLPAIGVGSRCRLEAADVAVAHGGFLALSSWLLGAHRNLTTKNQELTTKNLPPLDILLISSRLNI